GHREGAAQQHQRAHRDAPERRQRQRPREREHPGGAHGDHRLVVAVRQLEGQGGGQRSPERIAEHPQQRGHRERPGDAALHRRAGAERGERGAQGVGAGVTARRVVPPEAPQG
ncbi:MAG: hypothetical protein ACK56I_24425, partial [bacterium]